MKKKEIAVLYIITKLELGGAQKVCLSLLHELRKVGKKSSLISGNQGTLVHTLQDDKEIYLLEHFKREVSLLSFFYEIKSFLQIIGRIKSLKKHYPNLIVHTHSTKAGLLGRWAALCAGVKTRIHTVHGFGFHPYQHKIGWFINFCLEFITSFITTHYICVSSFDAKTGIRLLPDFCNKHSIIRASVNQNAFMPAKKSNLQEATFVFGTISCFKKQKNLFDLLQAFKMCYEQNPKVKLEIIGDGQSRKEIEQWIEKNNLEQHIILHGWQPEVSKFMQQWHAFVLSSLWEGLPCAVIEARLAKLPVISYDTGGIHDIIMHNQNGLLYKPKNYRQLAEGMLKISQNKDLYQKLTMFNDDLTDFHLNNMVEKHLQLYKSLL